MHLCAEQWFAGLCFPDTPNELCLLQGTRNGSLFPRSCYMRGSGEPGTGSLRRHHAMMPSPCALLMQLGSAASQGSATPCPPWSQQFLCPPTNAPLRGCTWPRTHSLLLCPSCGRSGTMRDLPLDAGCGKSCLFPPLAFTVI